MSDFISCYNARIEEIYTKMKLDPPNKDEYQAELDAYLLDCIPYIGEIQKEEENRRTENNTASASNMFTSQSKKTLVFKQYLVEVEKRNIAIGDKPQPADWKVVCPECESKNVITCFRYDKKTCTDCGATAEFIGDSSSNRTYKEETELEFKQEYPYSRANHFREWCSQFQGKENTAIPEEVLDKVRYEFKKLRIRDLKEITQPRVRTALKKMKLNKYYEHVPTITSLLTGTPAPEIDEELEDKLIQMFKIIQDPFTRNKPKTRKNFLSYSYVLYKFCELLGHDELLGYFTLLKSKEKLRQQDSIWKGICKDLRWEYFPTV